MRSEHGAFRVDAELFGLFPGMHLVVAVAHSLENSDAKAAIDALWREAWKSASALEVPNAQSHPRVRAWREDFKAFGVSMKRFPISIEAMLRRALKGGEPFRINPLVDFYNALSLRHICPAGAFDLAKLSSDIELRFTVDGDRFTALDEQEPAAVPAGEIAYTSGATVLTRHFMWRQARDGLVDAQSRSVFLVSEIPGVAGEPVARQMEQDMRTGLADYFGLDCQSFVISEALTRIDW